MIALSGVQAARGSPRWPAWPACWPSLAVWSLHLLKAYQLSRLTAFAAPVRRPGGTGYSAGPGQDRDRLRRMFGQGLFHGQLVAGNFVPDAADRLHLHRG